MGKQVTVFVGRAFAYNRKTADGVERFEFKPGANTVPADVADAPFVKAHQVSPPTAAASVDELQAALAAAIKRAEAAEAKVAELQASLDALAAMNKPTTAARTGK
ncbi:MAG TPA: hypothetical protein VNT52_00915 [Acidimicrobiales bacterium]|nr:hypothetical protein [Acidimicrobiales bacterium]